MDIPIGFLLSRPLSRGLISRAMPMPTNNTENQLKDTYKPLGDGCVCTFSLGLPALRQLAPGKISASNVYRVGPIKSAIVRPVSSQGLDPCSISCPSSLDKMN